MKDMKLPYPIYWSFNRCVNIGLFDAECPSELPKKNYFAWIFLLKAWDIISTIIFWSNTGCFLLIYLYTSYKEVLIINNYFEGKLKQFYLTEGSRDQFGLQNTKTLLGLKWLALKYSVHCTVYIVQFMFFFKTLNQYN